MTKHMTATEVLARERALLSKSNPELDAAIQNISRRLLDRLKPPSAKWLSLDKGPLPASDRELNETIRKMK